jgi:DNA-binding SARP family transcriptional activator
MTVTRLETRKAAALLASLALPPGRAHSRDALAEHLWPDEDPEATRSRLRQALSSIRRTLAPSATGSVLLADRSEVRLDPAAVITDVAEFEDFLRLADKAPDPGQRAQALIHAVALYQGDLLAGFDEEWILPERERLREEYLGALSRLANALGESGNPDAAIGYARRAVAADPLREPVHLDLMRLYAQAGRASEALREYRDLERILKVELDTGPSPEAQALALRLQSRPVEPVSAATPTIRAKNNSAASTLPASGLPAPSAPQTPAPNLHPLPRSRRRVLVAVCGLLLVLCAAGLFWHLLRPARTSALSGQRVVGHRAGALYGHGRDAWNRRTEADLRRALDHFREAIRQDRNHAPAWSGLADTYSLLAYYGHMPPKEAEKEAKSAVKEALALNPKLVETRVSQAWIAMTFDWDWITAEDVFLGVIAEKPHYATAYQWYSFYLMARERTDESLRHIRAARDLEPRPVVINKSVGQRYFHARKYEEAVEISRKRSKLERDRA